ncbi:hypothetical protein GYA54_02195 [Candidatus Kuenenbacteria bacterium]|nr:hypothetical protein [Candidatus Kuenenbacteria bacterium]
MRNKVIFLILIIIGLGLFFGWPRTINQPEINNALVEKPAIKAVEQIEPEKVLPAAEIAEEENGGMVEDLPAEELLAKKALIAVPFLSQAPFANWDPLHEDACEEASLIMLKYFLDGKKTITKETGEEEIQALVKYEEENGFSLSITLTELSNLAKSYYGLSNGRVETDINIEKIKEELRAGRPVIVGAAGKILDNPNFKNGGPIYHMLVIKGYDESGFITNDPGTRKGEGFRYTEANLFEAVHDWDENNILNGQKAYLVFD